MTEGLLPLLYTIGGSSGDWAIVAWQLALSPPVSGFLGLDGCTLGDIVDAMEALPACSRVWILFTLFPFLCSPASGQGWMTREMVNLNDHVFHSDSEAAPFFEIYDSMKAFYRGELDFDGYRNKLSAYSNGGYRFSNTAKLELTKMDSVGREHFERWSAEEVARIRREAAARDISPREFETLEFLFEKTDFSKEVAVNSVSTDRFSGGLARMLSANPHLRSQYDEPNFPAGGGSVINIKKDYALKVLGFPITNPSSRRAAEGWFLYWKMIYGGSSRQTAEMARNDFIAEQKNLDFDFERNSMENDLEQIRNDLRRLRRSLGN